MRESGTRLFLIAASVVIMSCSGRGDRAADVEQWSGEPPIAGAWLRAQLPPDTVAYVRIPHPLGLLAMPKGGTLGTALESAANLGTLGAVRRGLVENVLERLPLASNPFVALAVDKLKSPLEIAAVGPPTAGALIGATLDLADNTAFEDWLATSGLAQYGITLAAPLGDDGSAELLGTPVPAYLHFDAATQRLLVLASAEANADMLARAFAVDAGAQHPMHAAEARIDSSGQGLFAWLDVRSTLPLSQGFVAPGAAAQLGPLANANAIAFGAGTANGKGRLALLVEMAADAAARPLPIISNALTATSAGEPDAMLLFSIPSRAEMARLETLLLSAVPLPQRSRWSEAKTAFREATGVAIDEILTAVGPEVLAIMDSAGDYGALHLRDAALFEDIVQRLAQRLGSAPAERTIAGTTFSHWTLPSSMLVPAAQAAELGEVGAILGRLSTHLYWTVHGDYVYFAGLPQPLLDRARSPSLTNVGEWLREAQRIDASSSLLAAAGSVAKVPRRMYHSYVGFMQSLADFAGVEFDAFAMPTADDLALADEGAVSLAVNSGDPYVSLELSYEVHPGELLFAGGGIAAVATVGILAAIAIPAYEDYTTRATVNAGLDQAGMAQVRVVQHVQRAGRLPNEDEAQVLSAELVAVPPVENITVEGGSGLVIVDFMPGTVSGGGRIRLTPELGANGRTILSWNCEGSISPQHLPQSCR
jgi:hypothetical protein